MLEQQILKKPSGPELNAPSIDLSRFQNRSPGWQEDCKLLVDSFHRFGLVYIKDDKLDYSHNDKYLDLMERYFSKRSEQYDQGITDLDVSADHLGLKHIYFEKFTSHEAMKRSLKEPHLSLTPIHPKERDPTWRFRSILGSDKNVVPKDFPEFYEVLNNWGFGLKRACMVIAEMFEVGLGIEPGSLTQKLKNAELSQSPPAADLAKSKVGDVLTSFHHDFDMFTLHGKSRYPGLYAWLHTGEKFIVQVPQGHLLVQSGKQLEWMTGGYIKAGYHEVIHNEKVEENKLKALQEGRPAWRIATLLFCQCSGNEILKPWPKFQTPQTLIDYPEKTAGVYLNECFNILAKK